MMLGYNDTGFFVAMTTRIQQDISHDNHVMNLLVVIATHDNHVMNLLVVIATKLLWYGCHGNHSINFWLSWQQVCIPTSFEVLVYFS